MISLCILFDDIDMLFVFHFGFHSCVKLLFCRLLSLSVAYVDLYRFQVAYAYFCPFWVLGKSTGHLCGPLQISRPFTYLCPFWDISRYVTS